MSKQIETILNAVIIAGIIYLAFVVVTNFYSTKDESKALTVNHTYNITNYSNNATIISKRIHNPVTIFSLNSVKPINMSMATKEDILFIKFINESENDILNDTLVAGNAAQKNSLQNLGVYGIILKNDSQKYLTQIDQINVSPPFKSLFDEYRLYLDNSYQTGKYLESGSKQPLGNDLDIATENVQNAFEHLNNTHNILKFKIIK